MTQLDFLAGPYDFALDVGCVHNFTPDELAAYHREVERLLKPGGLYMLFAHLNDQDAEPEEQRWVDKTTLRQVFSEGFVLEWSLGRPVWASKSHGDQHGSGSNG